MGGVEVGVRESGVEYGEWFCCASGCGLAP